MKSIARDIMNNNTQDDLPPSVKEALQQIHTIEQFRKAWPFLKPIIKLLGADVKQIEESLVKAAEMGQNLQSAMAVTSRFNGLFVPRGWLLYDIMNVEVATAAVLKAEAGDIEGAEQDLVDYYSPDSVRMQLTWMMGIKTFRPRMALARKAQDDYTEGRYYACVPVVLALLDGLVSDLSGGFGFFVDGADLVAWDSLAAHGGGLKQLAMVLGRTRRTTTTEQIPVPYRNGILHGQDLGYDNVVVAAKAWAALFAVADWARKKEKGEPAVMPEEPKKGVIETLRDMAREASEHKKKMDDHERRMAAWSERHLIGGEDIPLTGEAVAYDEGTPERRLVEYLEYWQKRNYGTMADFLSFFEKKYTQRPLPAKLRAELSQKQLKTFEILEVMGETPAVSEIKTKLTYHHDVEEIYTFRLIYEGTEGHASVRGTPGGAWAVYTYPT